MPPKLGGSLMVFSALDAVPAASRLGEDSAADDVDSAVDTALYPTVGPCVHMKMSVEECRMDEGNDEKRKVGVG